MKNIEASAWYGPGSNLLHVPSGVAFAIPHFDDSITGRLVWEEIFSLSRHDEKESLSAITLYMRPEESVEHMDKWVAEPPEALGSDRYRSVEFPGTDRGLRATFRGRDSVSWKAGMRGDEGNVALLLGEARFDRADAWKQIFDGMLESIQLLPPGSAAASDGSAMVLSRPSPLRLTQCYAFLFFAASRATGGTSPEEARAIAQEMMAEWDSSITAPVLQTTMADGFDWLESAWGSQRVQDEIDFILRFMNGDPGFDRDRRSRLLVGLARVIAADGRLDDEEVTLHRYLHSALIKD